MNHLRKFRNLRGMSQLKLSYLTAIAPGDISRIENGWVRPYPGWRKRLAGALGVTEKELFPEEIPDSSRAESRDESGPMIYKKGE